MKTEPKAQMEIIEQMIAQSKKNISDGSVFYLIWGYLVLIAALSNYYLLLYSEYEHHYIGWPIFMTIGGAITGFVGARMEKKAKVKTFVDRAIMYLWIAVTVSIFVCLLGLGKFGAQVVYPFIFILYGIGTFVSGGILRFRPLIIGGILCWILGAIATHVDFSTQLILLIIAVLGSYIIPGHLLSKSKKNV